MPKQKYIVEKRTAYYNAGRENEFSEWEKVSETIATSEAQAIRNVTYNEGIKSYSKLDNDAGNDEEINTEYRAILVNKSASHSFSKTDIEKAALKGEPIPKDLPVYDTMLYYMLTGLYARYQAKLLTKNEAQKHKQVVFNIYQSVKDDYEQFTSICKEYQRRLKDGYSNL